MSTLLRTAIALALLPAAPALAATDTDAATVPNQSLVRLDRVNVFGNRAEVEKTAGSAHYIDQATLERFNFRDVNRVLRQVPGVYVVEEEGFGLRPNIGIRGSGTDRNNRITVMEDGVLIAPAPYAAPSAYYFPTMARMHAVEIKKGAAAVQAGPRTTGGALNLLSTPIPSETAGELDLAMGSNGSFLGHGWVGTSGENFSGMIEATRQQTDGFKQLDGGGDTGFELNDFVAKLRWTSSPDAARYQQVDLKLGRNTQDSDETYLGLTEDDYAATPFRRYAGSALDNIQTRHKLYELRHLIELGDNADLTTVAYRTEFQRNWFKLNDVQGVSISSILADPATYADQYAWISGEDSPANALRLRNNNRSYYAQGIQSVLGLGFATGEASHDLEIGLRVHRDQEDRYQNDDRFRMLDGELVLTTDGAPGTQDNRVGDAEALALYVQDTIEWGNWVITPGVRYEQIDLTRTNYSTATGLRDVVLSRVETDVDAVIPGIGATYLVGDNLAVFASVHRGFNPPGPGSDAEPEESVNTEFGLRYGADALSAELVGFVNDYSNLVGTCTASTGGNCSIGDQFDGGEARIQGIEASLAYDFGANGPVGIPVALAYTWTDAEFRNSFSSSFEEWEDVQSGDSLPYLPEQLLHASAGLRGERWRLDLAGNYIGEMRTLAGQGGIPAGERIDSVLLWDLAVGLKVTERLELYGRVENLSDETYVTARRPAGLRPGLPRTTVLGLRYKF